MRPKFGDEYSIRALLGADETLSLSFYGSLKIFSPSQRRVGSFNVPLFCVSATMIL